MMNVFLKESSQSFFSTPCRLRPQLSLPAVLAAIPAVQVAKHPADEAEADRIPLTTGSVAEFYIEPMLPHIGDIDVMYHWSTQLAIPRGHPVTSCVSQLCEGM